MKNQYLSATLSLMLTACVSSPSLNEIQATKPDVFKTEVSAIPKNCTLIPPKATSIVGTIYYKWTQADQSNSEIDPVLKAKNDVETQPFIWYVDKLNVASTAYIENKKNVKAGKCIVAYIDEWARTDALLGKMSETPNDIGMPMGRGFQKWLLSAIEADYIKVRDLATSDQDERIKWWMNQVAISVREFSDRSVNPMNNHYAWAGVAVFQAGIITDNKTNIEWGRKVFNNQMSDVSPDGSLPHEIARGKQALRYHNFGITPLIYMAQLSKMIGEDWTTNPNLQRFITFTTDVNLDPTILQKLTGKTIVPDSLYGWMGLLPDNDPNRAKMAKYGFPNVNYLGGNQTVMRDLIAQ